MSASAQNPADSVVEAAASGRLILTPNTELAAALIERVERRHLEAGHEIWSTPRIRDFSSWLRERYALRQLADASLPRCLNDVEERELWRAVIVDSDGGRELLDPNGAAQSARRARHTVFEYGIPLRKVAEYATEESLAFLEWNRLFEARCRELGCIPADQLLERLDDLADLPDLAWIESPLWQPVVRAWLRKNGGVMLSPLRAANEAAPLVMAAASPAAELAAIAAWTAGQLRTSPDFRAWICIPDLNGRRAEVRDAMDAALAPQRFGLSGGDAVASYAIAGGTPLAEYPPVRAALAVLSATLGSVSFENFSALLRMPELQDSPAEAGRAAHLDLLLRSRGPSDAELRQWLTLARGLAVEPVSSVRRLESLLTLIDSLRGAHVLSRWVGLWVDAFEAGPWFHRQRWSSAEFQAAERFRELLATLATGDALYGARGAAAAASLLGRAARDTAFQPQTGVPAIWVTQRIMDPWLDYQGLWVTGCGEDRWPPPADPVPLIPVKLQRDYGVISAGVDTQLHLAEELQSRWQSRAARCVFSCANSADGRPTTPSPILPASSPPAVAPVPTPVPMPHWQVLAASAPRLDALRDEMAPAFDAQAERTRGVATLRAQSRCAFRGYAETRLAVDRLDKPVPGFNQRERGELLHHALEYLWLELENSDRLLALTPGTQEALVAAVTTRAIAKQCEQRDPGERWRRREHPRMTTLLHKWLEVEKCRAPFRVEQLEQGRQIARFAGLEFRVRIDRVDELAQGGFALIDYKTGSVSADWRGDRPDNPQLPIYALLRPESVVAVAYGKVNAGECAFVAECERPEVFKPKGKASLLENEPNFASLISLWSQRIDKIAAQFALGHAEVAPTPIACRSCSLHALCRIPSALDDEEAEDE